MEAVIMEHRALLRNSILLIMAMLFMGCHSNNTAIATVATARLLHRDAQQISMFNGSLMINGQPYTGTMFTLYPGTNDTAEITSYLNGKEHGEWRKYYPSKKLKEKRFFVDGQKTGNYTAWWENGNKQLEYLFVADEYQGTCKEWCENGMLSKVMNYKMGHEDGHQQWWYDDGKIKANYVIKDGRRFGLLGTKNCINASDSVFKN